MSNRRPPQNVDRIRTGQFERRATMAKAGMVAGSKAAASSFAGLFYGKEKRAEKQKKMMSNQAQYLVHELGQLKGSIVKVGQMMALYGEHFLPDEITEALHQLEDQSAALTWTAMEPHFREQLGKYYNDFEIDPTPLGAASIGQVHRAKRIRDGRELCFKLQYPGVARAIDTDIEALMGMLRLVKALPKGPDFDDWLDEIRSMLHREVDYQLELETTHFFRERLKDDPRFIVPQVFPEYSTPNLLVTSYELGIVVGCDECMALPQSRRDSLGYAALDLFFKEFFVWGELQTDPNFGNYRLRLDPAGEQDKIVLLDFGAVKLFPESFMRAYYNVVGGAYYRNRERLLEGAVGLNFLRTDFPQDVQDSFVKVAYKVIEPFERKADSDTPAEAITANGCYGWGRSNLPERVARSGGSAALSRHFKIPPREFIFMTRKLVGVYTFLSVLDSQIDAGPMLKAYLQRVGITD